MAPPDDNERLRHGDRMDKSHMRDDFQTKPQDRLMSDGVHPSISCARMEQRLKGMGFCHIGGTCILSFMQHVGMMNHHNSECYLFQVGFSPAPHIPSVWRQSSNLPTLRRFSWLQDLETSQLSHRESLERFWATPVGQKRTAALDALVERLTARAKDQARAAAKAKRETIKSRLVSCRKPAAKRKVAASSSSEEADQAEEEEESSDHNKEQEMPSASRAKRCRRR